MLTALQRFWDRRRLRDPRFLALFERYRGSEAVSFDLETTSLDPQSCEVLSLAAVPVDAGGVRLSERFVRSIQSRQSFGIESIKVHRILPAESAAGVGLEAAIDEFLLWLGNRPLLGYYVSFDMAVVNRVVTHMHGFRLPNQRIELAECFARTLPVREGNHEPDLRLETIAQSLNLPLMGRHTALGDATSVGLLYAALQARRRAR